MNLLTLLLFSFLLSSCSKQIDTYYKYVYDGPTSLLPEKAVTEIDIWLSRILHRRLYKINKEGIINKDLVKSVTRLNKRIYHFQIQEDQSFSDGTTIKADHIVKSFLYMQSKSTNSIYQNIKKLDVISKYSFKIELTKENRFIKKLLASHLFPIINLDNRESYSGIYKPTEKELTFINSKDRHFPKVIKLIKVSHNQKLNFENIKYFDSALSSALDFKTNSSNIKYSIFEVWGIVLNLNDRFKNINERQCFDLAIDKKQLTEIVLKGHEEIVSSITKKCIPNKKLIKLQIPKELNQLGKDFCNFIKKKVTIECFFTSFNQILDNIRTGNFESALISLTVDLPYIESIGEYISQDSSFSIINIETQKPEDLLFLNGIEYVESFLKYLDRNTYFISLSRPKRTIYASELDLYTPSLIGPAYDSLENLIR